VTQAILKSDATALPKQPWLASVKWDCTLIIGPAIIASVIALACKPIFDNSQYMPLWAWVTLVLCVDVAHVYSTLFRTYFDKRSLAEHHALLVAIPIVCWVVGWLLYRTDDMYFWRALAYLAVFHFIRQQFGFVALYSRKDPQEFLKLRWLDQLCVYTVTLYPLLYWHTHLPRNFNWFVSGDFVKVIPPVVNDFGLAFYVLTISVYLAKELFLFRLTGFVNAPKNLILFGTALSWWVGIVALNSDLAFTMTNVVAHGIPYMALIWLYHNRTGRDSANSETVTGDASKGKPLWSNLLLSFAPAFLLFLVVLAYLEEGFWDGLVWREHLSFFAPFASLPVISDATTLSVLVPLLSLPQSTHYVLDGFIWRVKDKAGAWSAK
jgi:hypothetical protein